MMPTDAWCTRRRAGVPYFDNEYSIISVSCLLGIRFKINAKGCHGVMTDEEELCAMVGKMPYYWLMASVRDRRYEQLHGGASVAVGACTC